MSIRDSSSDKLRLTAWAYSILDLSVFTVYSFEEVLRNMVQVSNIIIRKASLLPDSCSNCLHYIRIGLPLFDQVASLCGVI